MTFQSSSTMLPSGDEWSTTPDKSGLGSSPFARRYLGNRCFFLFLRVLRCFSSPGYLLYTYIFSIGYLGIAPSEFPHSEICGSTAVCACPQLIAACHVLLRLLVPRHPPCALIYLTLLLAASLHHCVARSFSLACIHKYARFVFTRCSLSCMKPPAQSDASQPSTFASALLRLVCSRPSRNQLLIKTARDQYCARFSTRSIFDSRFDLKL